MELVHNAPSLLHILQVSLAHDSCEHTGLRCALSAFFEGMWTCTGSEPHGLLRKWQLDGGWHCGALQTSILRCIVAVRVPLAAQPGHPY